MKNFGVKQNDFILDFHPKIIARRPFYDITLLQSSLLNGKTTEIESLLQS